MTKKEAKKLTKGRLVTAAMQGEYDELDMPINPGDVIMVNAIIPKVCVRLTGEHKDSNDELIFGHRLNGTRVWLNFVNVRKLTQSEADCQPGIGFRRTGTYQYFCAGPSDEQPHEEVYGRARSNFQRALLPSTIEEMKANRSECPYCHEPMKIIDPNVAMELDESLL